MSRKTEAQGLLTFVAQISKLKQANKQRSFALWNKGMHPLVECRLPVLILHLIRRVRIHTGRIAPSQELEVVAARGQEYLRQFEMFICGGEQCTEVDARYLAFTGI